MSAALLGAASAHAGEIAGSRADADSSTVAVPARVRAWQVGLLRPDRLQHASLSFTLAAAANVATRRPGTAFAFTLSLGLAKEIWDSRHSPFDATDLAADAIGAAIGASVPRPESR